MSGPSAAESLALARQHLDRVQTAWDDPTDWADLCLYGFYCLEAAVYAGATHLNWRIQRNHREKVSSASRLHREHGMPDVSPTTSSAQRGAQV